MLSKNLGILLVVFGVLFMIYTTYNFFTYSNPMPADTLPIDYETPVMWIPLTGFVLLLSGIAVIEKSRAK